MMYVQNVTVIFLIIKACMSTKLGARIAQLV